MCDYWGDCLESSHLCPFLCAIFFPCGELGICEYDGECYNKDIPII